MYKNPTGIRRLGVTKSVKEFLEKEIKPGEGLRFIFVAKFVMNEFKYTTLDIAKLKLHSIIKKSDKFVYFKTYIVRKEDLDGQRQGTTSGAQEGIETGA